MTAIRKLEIGNRQGLQFTLYFLENFFNQRVTRTTAGAGVTGSRHFCNCAQSVRSDFPLDGAVGNTETSANERLVALPFVARGIAVVANRGKQRVTRQFQAVILV